MESYHVPSSEGLVPEKEYGIEFHARLSNEAHAMATKKNWRLSLQVAFPRLEITYVAAIPEVEGFPWVVFEVCFRAPYASPNEPIRFNTVARIIADHITETLGCGSLDTVEASYISAQTGTPGEVSGFFYKGYEGENMFGGRESFTDTFTDRLAGIWSGPQQAGRLAVVVVGGILAIKLVGAVRK